MTKELTEEEAATMIRARQIQKEKGLAKDEDISGICSAAGISRKTGYKWAEKYGNLSGHKQKEPEEKLARLQAEYGQLKKNYDDLEFENEGRKLAWEIHHVDEWLASKKTLPERKQRKSGRLLQDREPALTDNRLGAGIAVQHPV